MVINSTNINKKCTPMESVSNNDDTRKRKAHKKSRKGCGNCKLRRVKCDETRPRCLKCENYGVQCNYDGEAADDLHLPGEGAIVFSSAPASTEPTQPPKDSMSPETKNDRIDSMLGKPLTLQGTDEMYYMTQDDLDILRVFRDRTVFTIGTAQSIWIYRTELVNLVCDNFSYLTHVVLALTLMHIRSDKPWKSEPDPKESFHLYHGSATFNNLLSQPIQDKDKDPLWGTAALLGATTIASTEATKAEDCWPLRPPHPDDLDWIRMSDGKKEVWRLVDPLRPDSRWKEALDYDNQKDPTPYDHRVPELDLLYPFLIKIYDFDPGSKENREDPYHTAASILVRLLELDCNHSTIMYFLSFLGHMDPRFRQLLHEKDPKALLLLSWWYGKMCQYNCWWQRRRMKLEGQSICLYLERDHADKKDIMRLLDYPKMMTGLVGA